MTIDTRTMLAASLITNATGNLPINADLEFRATVVNLFANYHIRGKTREELAQAIGEVIADIEATPSLIEMFDTLAAEFRAKQGLPQ